jgi:hypothetical protein
VEAAYGAGVIDRGLVLSTTRGGWVLLCAAGFAGGLACAQPPSKGSIVCWTDDRGTRACGDHVPSQYADRPREIYDSRGVLLQTLPGAATPEQQAQAERAAREKAQAALQARHDTYLLQAYRSVADLQAERDARLDALNTRLRLAQQALADGQSTLKELRRRADEARAAGTTSAPELQKQIADFEQADSDNRAAVAQLQRERETTAAKYAQDIRRYLELRGAPPTPSP